MRLEESASDICREFILNIHISKRMHSIFERKYADIGEGQDLVQSQYEIDGSYLNQDRPMTKVTGYMYEVHLRGLILINVIPTAAEGSRLSFGMESQRRGIFSA